MEAVTNAISKTPRQGIRYENGEDRRKGYIEAQRRYNSKKWYCEDCSRMYSISNKVQRLKTKIHNRNVANYIEAQRRYNSKKWYCEDCSRMYSISNKVQHLKTKIHNRN